MSAECSAWAVRVRIKQSSVKNLLMVIADLANHLTGEVFASLGYLEDATGLSKKTVIAGIETLIEMGILERTDMRKGSTGQIPVYIFEMADGVEIIPKAGRRRTGVKTPPLPKGGKNDSERGDILPGKEGQKRHTEPSIRNQVDGTDKTLPSEGEKIDGESDLFGQALEIVEQPVEAFITQQFEALRAEGCRVEIPGIWTDARKKVIRTRARAAMPRFGATERDVWSTIFAAVRRNRFLRGQLPPTPKYPTPFMLKLSFLTVEKNFLSILEKGERDDDATGTYDPETGRNFGPGELAGRRAVERMLSREAQGS